MVEILGWKYLYLRSPLSCLSKIQKDFFKKKPRNKWDCISSTRWRHQNSWSFVFLSACNILQHIQIATDYRRCKRSVCCMEEINKTYWKYPIFNCYCPSFNSNVDYLLWSQILLWNTSQVEHGKWWKWRIELYILKRSII